MARGHAKAPVRGNPSNQSSQSVDTLRADSSNTTTPETTAPSSQRPSPTSTANTDPEPTGNLPPVPNVITPTEPVITPMSDSLRQKVTDALRSPRKRKRKALPSKSTEGEEASPEETATLRKLDRLIRWNCFVYFSNSLWMDVAKECYGQAFDIDSNTGQAIRIKIFDCVKAFKFKTIEHMEDHVKEIMRAPEHSSVKGLYTTRPLLLDFFTKLFTPGNFFAVWRYMEGYVEFEGSSDLGQYYMKSIYVNLAIEVKLYLDQCALSPKGISRDARDRLLTFYNEIPTHPNFKEVDKTDFKELQIRYRNQHDVPAKNNGETLKECFTSIGAPPPKKKQTMDDPAVR